MATKLYVGKLPEGAKDKDLRDLFQAFGEVEEVACLRGYGFVHFVKNEDANAAVSALDDSEFMGSHIEVQLARTKGHGYGRGSGPPRPRDYRDGRRGPPPRGYRDSGSSGLRDRRYGGSGYDGSDRYGGGGGGGGRYSSDYYEKGYDRPSSYDRGSGYERSYDRSYDRTYADRYDRYQDYDYGRYSDYRARSRSPPRDYRAGGGGSYESRDPYSSSSRESSRRW